jgi:hypothetical protein
MAKRLSTKHKARSRDKATAYKNGSSPAAHKVAVERSAKMKKRKLNRA